MENYSANKQKIVNENFDNIYKRTSLTYTKANSRLTKMNYLPIQSSFCHKNNMNLSYSYNKKSVSFSNKIENIESEIQTPKTKGLVHLKHCREHIKTPYSKIPFNDLDEDLNEIKEEQINDQNFQNNESMD